MAQNEVVPESLRVQIAVLRHNLEKGWSIPMSMRKARIKQAQHTLLLQIPEYKALIDSFKRQYYKRGWD